MNLSRLFILRPVMTTLLMITIGFFGIMAYRELAVSNLPNVAFPNIEVSISYPGADPITISNNVVKPLEQQFATIPGIQMISSQSITGAGTILLQFELDKSIDLAAPDVLAAINAALPQLPKDLPYNPTYSKTDPTQTPLIIFCLTSDTLTMAELYDYATFVLGERLNMVDGVSQVTTWGSPFAVRVRVDPEKLAARNIGIDEVALAIKNANVYLPTGTLYGFDQEYNISCNGQITHAEGYRDLIIKTDNGTITRLSDVGTAIDSLQNDKLYAHFVNKSVNKNMVAIGIQKQAGANTLKVIEGVKEKFASMQSFLPRSLEVWKMYDQSEYIKESVTDVKFTLLIALGLVVGVIFIYLGKMVNTLIPSLAIPLSILGTFIGMLLLGFSIDILSLMAITLAIGFLVDDAIVMLENIARHTEMGETRHEASLTGSKEISLTIVSMTICLAAVFIPLLFMGGIIGRVLREFSATIIMAIFVSGFVSLTATPLLCSRFIASYKQDTKKTRLERFSEKLNQGMLKIYTPSLKWAMRNRFVVLLSAFLCLATTIFLSITLPKDFLTDDDIGFVQGFVQSVDGTSPFKTAEIMDKVTNILQKNPHVAEVVALGASNQDNQGLFFAQLSDIHERPSSREVIKELYKELSQIVGSQIFLKSMPLINLQIGTSDAKGDYQYTLQSLHAEELYSAAVALQNKLKTFPHINKITSDLDVTQPQLSIEILRDKAYFYGVTAESIENALTLAFGTINLSPINEPANQYYVIMEVLPKYYRLPKMLDQLWVRSNSGKLVPFTEVVKVTENLGPLTVNHVDGLPSATITFNLEDGIPLETALKEVEQAAKEILPSTVFGKVQGAANIFKQSFANLNFLLLIAIFIIYIILGILYENFFHPITVMSTLPPAALGGLLTLLICGYSLSLYAFVGIMMLLGIVLKNGIILIDFANEWAMKENKTSDEAILHACQVRFRPILMTTMAALMGALPIALGLGGITAQGRKPLGAVVVGGLIVAQILTLYLTPITYLYIEKLRRRSISKKDMA